MSEILQANIFFFITSVAVVVFTILLCTILYQILKIVKSVKRIVDRVEAGSEQLASDMSKLRSYFQEGGFMGSMFSFFMSKRGTEKKQKRRSRVSKD